MSKFRIINSIIIIIMKKFRKYTAKLIKQFNLFKIKLRNIILSKELDNYDNNRNIYILKLIERDLSKLYALETFRKRNCSREKVGLNYCKNKRFYNNTVNNILTDIEEKISLYNYMDTGFEGFDITKIQSKTIKSKGKTKNKKYKRRA